MNPADIYKSLLESGADPAIAAARVKSIHPGFIPGQPVTLTPAAAQLADATPNDKQEIPRAADGSVDFQAWVARQKALSGTVVTQPAAKPTLSPETAVGLARAESVESIGVADTVTQGAIDILKGADRHANAALGGDVRETISARLGRGQVEGTSGFFGDTVSSALNWIDPGHVQDAYGHSPLSQAICLTPRLYRKLFGK